MNRYSIALDRDRMLPVQEALKLTDISELKFQIEIRKKLVAQMVGWLYPSIMSDEMNLLSKRISDLGQI